MGFVLLTGATCADVLRNSSSTSVDRLGGLSKQSQCAGDVSHRPAVWRETLECQARLRHARVTSDPPGVHTHTHLCIQTLAQISLSSVA